jgi:hypothetical protein
LLGVPTNPAFVGVDTSKAYIFHPNRLQFAISLDTPVAGETALTVDNTNVTFGRDIYNTKKYTGQDAFFYGHYDTN